MFLSKFVCFLTFTCCLNAGRGEDAYRGVKGKWPVPDRGLNNSCGKNIRMTVLTDPIHVTEDPHWDEASGSIFFASDTTPAPGVHRYVIDTKEHYYVDLESQGCSRVSTPLPVKDAPGKYFFACNDNLSVLNWDGKSRTASFRNVSKPYPENPDPVFRLKSGKVAPSGALLIFSDPVTFKANVTKGTLLAIINGKAKKLAKGIVYGVGMGFSPDGTALYFSDFTRKYLYKARYNPRTDSIENVRVLLDFSKIPALQYPDGSTVDSEGYVWVACFLAGLVIKVDPYSGEVVCSIEFPVKELTNLTFGRRPETKSGPQNCLYVTSLKDRNKDTGPIGHSLYVVEGVHAVGVPPHPLRLNTIVGNSRRYFGEQ